MLAGDKSSTLDLILGSRSKIAVLRSLANNRHGYSGSGIAQQTGMGLFAVQNALASLESGGLIKVERGSRENRYKLNGSHYLVDHGLRALFKGERDMTDALIQDLRKLLKGKVIAAGLFGSFAKGAVRAGSDIDVMIVVKNAKERETLGELCADAQVKLTERYGWPVQPVVLSLRQLLDRRANGPELLKEAERDWQPITGLMPAELKKVAQSTLGGASS